MKGVFKVACFTTDTQTAHFAAALRLSPVARMNCPSRDTLMEVHTVGISKSWMSSILRWMSGREKKKKCLINDVHFKKIASV